MNKEISPLDVKVLISSNKRAYDFVLDGTHFGRGDSYISEYEQVKYQYDVIDLKKWKVNENENSLETVADIECFYSDDSYIVYAKFRVTKFDLNSERVVENSSDDTKEIYFYWRGWHASKGYSPLPKELNVEDVPVERTYQWTETPVFLRLFNGKLIVHNKSLKSETTHFYILCGTVKEEANLIEIPREKKNLRSRTSFLLVVPQEHEIYVWYGSKAHNRNFLENVLLSLQEKQSGVENKPFNVIEVNEKENDEKFLSYLTGGDNDYFSLTNDLALYHHSPRLFYFHSITGDFTASEIEYTLGSDYLNPFPFLQDHLYTATQPGKLLFLWIINRKLKPNRFQHYFCWTTLMNFGYGKDGKLKQQQKSNF